MKNEVLDFIQRRWRANDSNWLNGNCYWFALILCIRFKYLDIYYLPIIGHFIAGDGENYYDQSGQIVPEEEPILLEKIFSEDKLWFQHLMRDCRD